MDKKTIVAIAIGGILLTVAIIVTVIYKTPTAGVNPTPTQHVGIITDSQDDFSLVATYLGDSSWKYVVTGQLPNPCIQTQIDTLVAESYPEQVTVRLSVTSDPTEMCAQVITDYRYEGTFTASEKAVARLIVND